MESCGARISCFGLFLVKAGTTTPSSFVYQKKSLVLVVGKPLVTPKQTTTRVHIKIKELFIVKIFKDLFVKILDVNMWSELIGIEGRSVLPVIYTKLIIVDLCN